LSNDEVIDTGIDIGAVPTLIDPALSHDGGVDEDVIIAPEASVQPSLRRRDRIALNRIETSGSRVMQKEAARPLDRLRSGSLATVDFTPTGTNSRYFSLTETGALETPWSATNIGR
jgi:hypothetical protein